MYNGPLAPDPTEPLPGTRAMREQAGIVLPLNQGPADEESDFVFAARRGLAPSVVGHSVAYGILWGSMPHERLSCVELNEAGEYHLVEMQDDSDGQPILARVKQIKPIR